MEKDKFKLWSCRERGNIYYSPPGISKKKATRTWYQRDTDQIVYSTVFRKMQRKSQLLSEFDLRRRTRLIHTLEVARIAREISYRLGIDTTLTEAIALGHDIANGPFGSSSNRILEKTTGFSHDKAGAYMLQTLSAKKIKNENTISEIKKILKKYKASRDRHYKWKGSKFKLFFEKKGKNFYEFRVSPELINSIKTHTRGKPTTLEGQVVQFSDNIAYISQDVDDLIRTKLLRKNALPKYKKSSLEVNGKEMTWSKINSFYKNVDLKKVFSNSGGDRIGTMIERYVNYNIRQLDREKISWYRSSILNKKIPRLIIDEGLNHVIDFFWKNIIEPHYEDNPIKISNALQEAKIEQLLYILRYTDITKNNHSIKRFLKTLESSRFKRYNKDWKLAYLISHLSWDEVEMILKHYHQRDKDFLLDII